MGSSNLSTKNLQDFNFSDTMAKFKSEEILKQSGYTGKSHNRDEIILDVVSREVIPQNEHLRGHRENKIYL